MRKSFAVVVGLLVCYVGVGFAQVQEEWVARYNGPGNFDDFVHAIAVDSQGNVSVTGDICVRVEFDDTGIPSCVDSDYATIKYDPDGNELWIAHYNGPGNGFDVATAIALDAAGNVYVTGSSEGVGTRADYATIKYDPDGNELWAARYNGLGNDADLATAIAVDAAGNVYVTGGSRPTPAFESEDYATIKYDPDGNELWVARYIGPGNRGDVARAIALDAAGNVYVTGWSWGVANDYATIKYDPDGNELWVARYNGPGNSNDQAFAIALDAAGNVYVTGESRAGVALGTEDYATIKYDPDGNELWVARYNGLGNSGDVAIAIALGAAGNVYVTGWSYQQAGFVNADYATIKYDPDGNELWVTHYNGPGNSTDAARAIAVDAAGNVYVTGDSWGGLGANFDYGTIKYDPDGNELWVARYNGPGNSTDAARAIAVDAVGNVYVTGLSVGLGTSFDYATIKYTQAQAADFRQK